MMYLALIKGFASSAGLIVAIGAQNAFVLRQALRGNHLLLIALLCSFIDAILITIGVMGFGQAMSSFPLLIEITKYASILFLTIYGAISLKSVFICKHFENASGVILLTRRKAILMLLGLSLLNPHVYLDTVILLGSIASQYQAHEQIYFSIGAIAASFAWFFTLCYGTRFIAPILNQPLSWKIIDLLVALIMWGMAISMIAG